MSKRNLLCFMLFLFAILLFAPPLSAEENNITLQVTSSDGKMQAGGVDVADLKALSALISKDKMTVTFTPGTYNISKDDGLVISKSVSIVADGVVFVGSGYRSVPMIKFTGGNSVTASIRGITIKSAHLSMDINQTGGAGILIDSADTVNVSNCVFISNDITLWKIANTGHTGGAAIYTKNAKNIAIESCDFTENQIKGQYAGNFSGSSCNEDGGCAIYNYALSVDENVIIRNCTFTNNGQVADGSNNPYISGGAIANITYANNRELSVDIVGCTFVGNKAVRYGGAVYNLTDVNNNESGSSIKVKIADSTFTNNMLAHAKNNGSFGGAVYNYAYGNNNIIDMTVTNSLFKGNIASEDTYSSVKNYKGAVGGAIAVWAEAKETARAITIVKGCRFEDNKANSGGAVANIGNTGSADMTVEDCTFVNNTAKKFINNFNLGETYPRYSIGSAIVNTAYQSTAKAHIRVINSTFTGNNAYLAGAFGNLASSDATAKAASADIVNCTFVDNNITSTDRKNGTEVYNLGGTVKLINTLLYNSSTDLAAISADKGKSPASTDLTNSAFSGAQGAVTASTDSVVITTLNGLKSHDVSIDKVTHTVFRLTSSDKSLIRGGTSGDNIPKLDVLRFTRSTTKPSLGAVEYIGVTIVSPDKASMDAEEYAFFSVGIKAKVEPEQGDSTTLTITIESTDLTSYGLSFDASTGTLSGKPTKAGAANFTVKAVAASDASMSASKAFTLTVKPATLKKISADFGGSDQMTLTLTEGETASLDLAKKLVISGDFGNGVTALKPGSCDITWSGTSGVTGITFANGSVDVAGTAKAGKYSFDVTATVSMDNKQANAKVKVVVTINEKLYAPKLSASGTSGDVKKGSSVTITVTATSADKVLWTGSGNIPTGASLTSTDTTLTISGTVTATGSYTYTVTAKNAKSADLSASTTITFKVSNTTAEAPVKAQPGAISTTRDAETGNTVISRITVFTTDGSDNGDGTASGNGTVILSTDIAITIESTDLKASADEEFSRTVSVDVTFRIVETSYKNYVYSLDITGYPAWLKVSGDVKSTDKALTNGKRTHVFRIYGTPTSKDATNAPDPFSLIANVTISNDHNVLNASADCDVKIYVASKDNPLTSIAVEITGEQIITLNFDSADAKSYDVVVTGTYADASQAVLSADDYTVVWTHGTLSAGITFSNNTLSVAANTSPDTYTVVLTATVTAGSLTKSADKTVTITVNAKPAPAEVTPVLSGDNLTQTVNKGSAITDITITVVSGDNITWSASGTLPEGLAVSSGDKTCTISGTVADSAAIQAYTYTVTATNSKGSASVEVAITVTGSSSSNPDDDITPEHGEIQTTTDAATGNTIISRKSVFSNSNGIPVLSTDIVITIETLEFTASVDETFSKTVSVDVTLEIAEDSYKNYFYSMDVTGKPAWLNVEGELESSDKALTAGKRTHVFRIYGTPASSDAASNPDPISLIANVTISNDYNVLNASADCNVKIYVASKDEEPETVTLTSIDVEIAGVSEITLNFGSADAQHYTAIVSGDYGSGWTALNAGSYDVTWSTGTLADGITFTDKTLSVSAATAAGEYTVEITATVTAEGLTKSAVKTVKITVNEASSSASVDVKPVLSGTNLTQTVEKGKAITAITITATSGDNLTWTASGTLPEGLAVSSGDKTCTISGTVADSAAIQVYTYTVAASNTAGSAEITVRITVTRTVTPDAAPTSPGVTPTSPDVTPTSQDVTPTSQDVTPTSTDVIPTPSNPDAEVIIMDTGDVIAVDNSGNLEVLVSQTGNLADILTQMSDAEKSTITSIKINDSITDLSGLNDLTNLEQLDLKEATSLENVDLRGNTSIKTLEVTGNSAIKNLTLAGSGVKTVEADSCEGLEEVDVEGCEELEYLNVSNTGTTVLNARNCANLQVLACGSCEITQLNLEGCLSLRDLDCIGNALLRLDAYLFPVLESLNCSDQKRSGWTPSRRMSFGVFLNSMTVSAADAGDGTESGEEDNSYLANVDNLKAFDSAGNEIGVTYDKETGEAEFAQTPASFSYEYITGFNGIRMDVTIASDGSQSGTDETSHVVGNPGGGCNAGFGAAAILMALAAVLGKKRKA